VTGRSLVSLASLALAGSVLSACGDSSAYGDDDPIPAAAGVSITGTQGRFMLPTGSLTVTVGPAQSTLSADETEEGEDRDAPDGGRYVPVSYVFEAAADLPGRAIIARHPQETTVTVQADGASVELPAPYDVAGQGLTGSFSEELFVPVSGSEPSVTVAATYDGLTQTFEVASGEVESGAAAPLYEASTNRDADCSTMVADPVDAHPRVSCEATVEEVPYVPGQGWAADGSTFVAVGYRLRVDSVPGFEVTGTPEAITTLGQATPVESLHVSVGAVDSPEEITTVEIFAADGTVTEAEVDATFSVVPKGSPSETGRPLSVQATIPVS
jgi:hypothetical protein